MEMWLSVFWTRAADWLSSQHVTGEIVLWILFLKWGLKLEADLVLEATCLTVRLQSSKKNSLVLRADSIM